MITRRAPLDIGLMGLALAGAASLTAHARPGEGDGLLGRAEVSYEHAVVPPSRAPLGSARDEAEGAPLEDVRQTEGTATLHLGGGTRGLGRAGLNSFFSGQLLIDPFGAPTGGTEPGGELSALPSLTDGAAADGSLLALHLVYVELEGVTERGLLADAHLRAGRQFHWGIVPVTFDGVTAGYDGRDAGFAVRGGRRSAVYDPDPGDAELIAGLDGHVTVGGRRGLRIDVEYLMHRQTLDLITDDRVFVDGPSIDRTLHLAQLQLSYMPDRAWFFSLDGTLTDWLVERIDAEVGYVGDTFSAVLTARQKVDAGLSYDLALGLSPRHEGRATNYETHRLSIPDPGIYTDIGLESEWALTEHLMLAGHLGTRQVLADEALTVYDADQYRWTLRALATADIDRRSGLELNGSYGETLYGRDAADPGGAFADPTVGGDVRARLAELAVRYVRGRRRIGGRLLAGRMLDLGLRAYAERWTLANRFIGRLGFEGINDSAIGLAVDGSVQLSEHFGVGAGYEVARDTTHASSWLEPLQAVRVSVSGRL